MSTYWFSTFLELFFFLYSEYLLQNMIHGKVHAISFIGFSWGFSEEQIMLLCQLISLFFRHKSFVDQIFFVPKNTYLNILFSVLLQFFEPKWHIFKRLTICNVVYDDGAMGIFVISVGNCSIFLLTGSVPKLYLYIFVVDLQIFCWEIYAYRVSSVTFKNVSGKSWEKVGFTNTWIPN